MKRTFNIIRYIHYGLTAITIMALITFIMYFKTDYGNVIAFSVAITYLNFLVSLIFFVPVLIYLSNFKAQRANSPYLTSYVIYVVSGIVSIMLIPLIQSFL